MAAGDLTTLASVKRWLSLSVAGKAITAITKANPGAVTCTGHNLITGQVVGLTGVNGMTQVNGQTVTVTVVDADHFTIGIDTSAYGTYTSGGLVGTDDGLLVALITAASSFIQNWIGYTIASASYTDRADGTGGTTYSFQNYPVTAVTSLTIDGQTIPPAPNSASVGYVFNDHLLMLRGYAFSRGFSNVVVTYTAGYASTPADVDQACVELVGLKYRERDRIGQVSKSLAGEVVAFSQKDMSDNVKTALKQYRRVI